MSREVMEISLEALLLTVEEMRSLYGSAIEQEDAIEALRVALAQPEPEPVAIVQQEAYGRGQVFWAQPASTFQDGTPLYTAPPRREWVGLTEKDIVGCFDLMPPKFARAVEAKLKEKNI